MQLTLRSQFSAGLFNEDGKLLGSASSPIQIWKDGDCVEVRCCNYFEMDVPCYCLLLFVCMVDFPQSLLVNFVGCLTLQYVYLIVICFSKGSYEETVLCFAELVLDFFLFQFFVLLISFLWFVEFSNLQLIFG